MRAWAAGGSLPRRPIAITFDDGYLDNLHGALPILQRHGLRATFFIASGYVGGRRVFWWDRINYVLKSARREEFTVGYPESMRFDLRTAAARARSIRSALDLVKKRRGLDLERFLDELGRAAGVEWTRDFERSVADELLMTWDDVRALRDAGMDVQSHTRMHRVLQTLDDDQIVEELRTSRADLERELGGEVRTVSYPIGRTIDDRPSIRDAMRAAGYELGFTNATGPNFAFGGVDRYAVRRLSMNVGTPDAVFRTLLALPTLAGARR
jgi:peptidoglycan/xylan/chitin deacetylase (PgdA/CDA1 family)